MAGSIANHFKIGLTQTCISYMFTTFKDNWSNGWFYVIFWNSSQIVTRKKSMLSTLWILETSLFPMSNKTCIPTFRHLGLMGSKWHPFESDNFEACSVRPPVPHVEIDSLKVLPQDWECHQTSPVQGCQVRKQTNECSKPAQNAWKQRSYHMYPIDASIVKMYKWWIHIFLVFCYSHISLVHYNKLFNNAASYHHWT